jgi:hypothetical protein
MAKNRFLSRIRELKHQFDAQHRKGMQAVRSGDYPALDEVVKAERAIVDEHAAIIDEHLTASGIASTVAKQRK